MRLFGIANAGNIQNLSKIIVIIMMSYTILFTISFTMVVYDHFKSIFYPD
jgi:hypothetical protein